MLRERDHAKMTDWVEECDENVDATIEAWMKTRAEPCFRDGGGPSLRLPFDSYSHSVSDSTFRLWS